MYPLKNLLIHVRWGDTLTEQDIALASEMSFLEIFASSYLNPKTPRVRTSKTLRRR